MRQTLETGKVGQEGEPDISHRAVSLFSDNDLGHALVERFTIVDFFAIEKKD